MYLNGEQDLCTWCLYLHTYRYYYIHDGCLVQSAYWTHSITRIQWLSRARALLPCAPSCSLWKGRHGMATAKELFTPPYSTTISTLFIVYIIPAISARLQCSTYSLLSTPLASCDRLSIWVLLCCSYTLIGIYIPIVTFVEQQHIDHIWPPLVDWNILLDMVRI